MARQGRGCAASRGLQGHQAEDWRKRGSSLTRQHIEGVHQAEVEAQHESRRGTAGADALARAFPQGPMCWAVQSIMLLSKRQSDWWALAGRCCFWPGTAE